MFEDLSSIALNRSKFHDTGGEVDRSIVRSFCAALIVCAGIEFGAPGGEVL